VEVILFGANPALEERLNELPRARRYETIVYRSSGSAAETKLIAGASGGVSNAELSPILRAIPIERWWSVFDSPWRLAIHGDDAHVRVTVRDSSRSSTWSWLLIRHGAEWVVLSNPAPWLTLPPQVDLESPVTPYPVEIPVYSNVLLPDCSPMPKIIHAEQANLSNRESRGAVDRSLIMKFTIQPRGSVTDPIVVASDPPNVDDGFDAPAMEAIVLFKFAPVAAPCRGKLKMTFKIREES